MFGRATIRLGIGPHFSCISVTLKFLGVYEPRRVGMILLIPTSSHSHDFIPILILSDSHNATLFRSYVHNKSISILIDNQDNT